MPSARPTPFSLVFGATEDTAFPSIQAALRQTGTDPRDRDAFLILRETVTLLHQLRPDDGLGEGIDQLAALIHHCYLFWASGLPTVELPLEHLENFLSASFEEGDNREELPAYYAQFPERRIWAEAVPGTPPEPLDGCFVHASPDSTALRVLGVFGLHRERAGFTVVEVAGGRPAGLARPDGGKLFSPTLSGGAAAGLFSLAGGEELLELGWRTGSLLAPTPRR